MDRMAVGSHHHDSRNYRLVFVLHALALCMGLARGTDD
jgi:hypothetical protein